MSTYTLSRDNLEDIRRSLTKVLLLVSLVAIGPLAMVYALSPPDHIIFFIVLALYIATVAFAVVLAIFHRARSTYTIDNTRVTFHRPGHADTTILRSDVDKIIEDPESGITIYSSNLQQNIHVPRELTDYEHVKIELNSWKPLEAAVPSTSKLLVVMISLIAVSGIAAIGAFVFRIRFFVLIFGLTFLAIVAIGMYESSKEQKKPKRPASPAYRVILILVILYFVYEFIKSSIN